MRLKKAGIIPDDDGIVAFPSLLAERYFSTFLFPERAAMNPPSPHKIIRLVLGRMSALRQSTGRGHDFPNEATLQRLFMQGLAQATTLATSICHELSRAFSPRVRGQTQQRNNGDDAFYLNGGDLHWGIALLVNGSGGESSEPTARFRPSGKYAPLNVSDCVVVDLRGNATGDMTDVTPAPERGTLFFKLEDFSSCRCVFGLATRYEQIQLAN